MFGLREWCRREARQQPGFSRRRGATKRRLLLTPVLIVSVLGATATAGLATSTPASADTVVNGCTIVANPTPTNFTNCPGADLSSANLSGVNLSFANLAGARFVDCSGLESFCQTTDLALANLTEANLSNAVFAACSFAFPPLPCGGANLTDANLTDANLTDAVLAFPVGLLLFSAYLAGANLAGANFTGTVLVPSDQNVVTTSNTGAVVNWSTPLSLPGATPGTCTPSSGSTFPPGNTSVTCQVLDDLGNEATGTFTVRVQLFTTTDLSSSLNPSMVGQRVIYTATVSPTPTGGTVRFDDNGVALTGCSAVPLSGGQATCSTTPVTTGAHNIVASYSGSAIFQLSFSSLTQVITQTPCKTLAGCNLQGLNLTQANLPGANLEAANLKGANLFGAYLPGANLSGANLSGANLTETVLSGANLTDANLSGANLTFANLSRADLSGVNLAKVVWSNTTCPDGTNSNADGGTCVGHL